MKTLTEIAVPSNHPPRYSPRPFPAYRFVPGLHPHPTEHPQGHSYGLSQERQASFEPQAWANHQGYLYGVDLYNYAYWWESHESFEGLWRSLAKGDHHRDCLQGLIKISAAFLKWHLRQRRGVIHHYRGAVRQLQQAAGRSADTMGIHLPGHLVKLAGHFKTVTMQEDIWPDPVKDYPFLTLRRVG